MEWLWRRASRFCFDSCRCLEEFREEARRTPHEGAWQGWLLPAGTRVALRGLGAAPPAGVPPHAGGAAAPHAGGAAALQGRRGLEGRVGVLRGYDAGSARYVCELEGSGALLVGRAEVVPLLAVELTAMRGRADLNGRRGVVCGADPRTGRYLVQLHEGVVAAQPRNLLLPLHARVIVGGLVSAPQWNGRLGEIVAFDPQAMRYTVAVSESKQLRVKLENRMESSEAEGSIVNEIFSLAWQIASADGEVDTPFWQWVRLLADACRTPDDWERLRATLLGISLDPRMDKAPIYHFRVGANPAAAHGLRGSARRRARRGAAGGGEGASRRGARRVARREQSRERRARLRELLDGEAEAEAGEWRALCAWLLEESGANEEEWREERRVLAEELVDAMRQFERAAKAWKPQKEAVGDAAVKAEVAAEGGGEATFDVLRAAAGGAAAGALVAAGEAEAAAAAASEPAAPKEESVEEKLRRVGAAKAGGELFALGELLLVYDEEVCVQAALAIGELCARDEQRQAELAALGALPRIAALLDQPFSERGRLDICAVLACLAANAAHHPSLLEQLVGSGGVPRVLALVGVGGALASPLTREGARLVRSLAGVEGARGALVEAGAVPRLLRLLLAATPAPVVDAAAAALAVLLRHEPLCRAQLLQAGGVRSLVALLARPSPSAAAVSAAACVGYLCAADQTDAHTAAEARRAAAEAHAVEALLPLLDGCLGEHAMMLSAARNAATAIAALCRGSARTSTQLRALGGLQTLVAILRVPATPDASKLQLAAIDAIRSAASADLTSGLEVIQHGGVLPLAVLVKGGDKKLSAEASSLLELLSKRGDPTVSKLIAEAMAAADGLPNSVRQLRRGTEEAARAARRIDASLQSGGDAAIDELLQLGGVPLLVDLLRGGAHDAAAVAALGPLELLWHSRGAAQDEAREAGVFTRLVEMVRLEGELQSEEGPSVRSSAILALTALVRGNRINREKALEAGAEAALVCALDGGGESEEAALAVEGLRVLGLSNMAVQEDAVRATTTEAFLIAQRVDALAAVWGGDQRLDMNRGEPRGNARREERREERSEARSEAREEAAPRAARGKARKPHSARLSPFERMSRLAGKKVAREEEEAPPEPSEKERNGAHEGEEEMPLTEEEAEVKGEEEQATEAAVKGEEGEEGEEAEVNGDGGREDERLVDEPGGSDEEQPAVPIEKEERDPNAQAHDEESQASKSDRPSLHVKHESRRSRRHARAMAGPSSDT
ncbi:hypothetical protein AB1Y20_019720 [Prymnesium parvum]|uniref:RING-type E3 ubiquitin transferase n=1 Tax=Prymnesium parvum TaxID=97485 RepID=A0AB34JT72_PRYPA